MTMRIILSTKTECDYLKGWIKKMVTYTKYLTQNGEPQRHSWGTQKKKDNNSNIDISNNSNHSNRDTEGRSSRFLRIS